MTLPSKRRPKSRAPPKILATTARVLSAQLKAARFMKPFFELASHTGRSEHKHFKATLVRGDQMMLGVNCLEPGQVQRVHSHADQDKFYYVVEGEGRFTVGTEVGILGPGTVIWAPAGIDHGVENAGTSRLTVFMGMAPPPS